MPHIMDNGELAENRPSPLVPHLRSWRLIVVIGSLCPGTFLLALDINIIGVAVPKITSTFH